MSMKNFWKVKTSWQQKRCCRNHIMCIFLKFQPWNKLACYEGCRKIIGTQSLLVCSIDMAMESQETPNKQYPQSAKLISSKLLKCYSSAFKMHWNNTGTICLNMVLQTWDMFLPSGLTELHMFFMTRNTTFLAQLKFPSWYSFQ